jgi:hypothetical protein
MDQRAGQNIVKGTRASIYLIGRSLYYNGHYGALHQAYQAGWYPRPSTQPSQAFLYGLWGAL